VAVMQCLTQWLHCICGCTSHRTADRTAKFATIPFFTSHLNIGRECIVASAHSRTAEQGSDIWSVNLCTHLTRHSLSRCTHVCSAVHVVHGHLAPTYMVAMIVGRVVACLSLLLVFVASPADGVGIGGYSRVRDNKSHNLERSSFEALIRS
jgi:hypothetical protein